MKLHQNKELFQDAVLAASQRFGIPEIYVEKDYWVTLVLYEIFHSNIADQTVFKGGTSLSKCHKLIISNPHTEQFLKNWLLVNCPMKMI